MGAIFALQTLTSTLGSADSTFSQLVNTVSTVTILLSGLGPAIASFNKKLLALRAGGGAGGALGLIGGAAGGAALGAAIGAVIAPLDRDWETVLTS